MEQENNNAEFELSFNFKNVLYIAQVNAKTGPGEPYYSIVYFSPNEKGEIPVLIPGKPTMGEQSWEEPGHAHELAFISEIGRQIEEKNKAL